jgi:hypothetical protein
MVLLVQVSGVMRMAPRESKKIHALLPFAMLTVDAGPEHCTTMLNAPVHVLLIHFG